MKNLLLQNVSHITMEFKMIFTAGNGSLQTGKGFLQTGNENIYPISWPLIKATLF